MKITNGYSVMLNGWKYISIKGNAYERGVAYGALCAEDFKEIQKMLRFFMFESYGLTWEYFIHEINKSIGNKVQTRYPEFFEEMVGIVNGCVSKGTNTTIEEILAWNFYMSIPYWHSSILAPSETHINTKEGGSRDKCSAFIAVGDYTHDGKIVVAHNSFTEFLDGQYMNLIVDIYPTKGYRMIMQTSPCWIWSGTDFFVTSAGIIGTETTIGGFFSYENNMPICFRIREAMQYGKTMDDYVTILVNENSGDYANSWLFGDINTNEILRLELGLKYHNVERTRNGYYIGFNATYDPRIRNLECHNDGFNDIRRHQGARKVRLNDLMEQHKGKINIHIAQQIISDHYDVYLHKENPCSRTVCSHYELDAREYMSQIGRPLPYSPRGAVDGVVCDSAMAKNMSFLCKWGASCDLSFDAKQFCDRHRQWNYLLPYLHDRPTQPWTLFSILRKYSKYQSTNKHIKRNKSNKNNKSSRTK